MPIKYTRREWWSGGNGCIYGLTRDGQNVVRIAETPAPDSDEDYITDEELEADCDRIVGCVNGCQGIGDPAHIVPELVGIVRDLYQRTNSGHQGSSLNLRELKRVLDRCDVL